MQLKSLIVSSKLGWLKRQCDSPSFLFPKAVCEAKRVLICLPEGLRELTLVKPYLPEIADVFSPAEMYLLATPGSHVANVFPRKGFRILAPGESQRTWSGLSKSRYLETLRKNKFDLIIDLNLRDNPFVASTLLNFSDILKIGVSDHLGEPFYNLQIRTPYMRDERNIYRSFVDMLANFKNPVKGDSVGQTRLSGI